MNLNKRILTCLLKAKKELLNCDCEEKFLVYKRTVVCLDMGYCSSTSSYSIDYKKCKKIDGQVRKKDHLLAGVLFLLL